MDFNMLFSQIQSILGSLQTISSGQSIKVSRQEVNQIKDLYRIITNGRRVNTACASCVEQAAIFINNWYNENYPLYNISQKNGTTKLKIKSK